MMLVNSRFLRQSVLVLNGLLLSLSSLLLTTKLAYAEDWLYTVRPGDTIWDICEKYTHYELCWKELPAYNQLDRPRIISPGEQLAVPANWLKELITAAEVAFFTGQVIFERGSLAPADVYTGLKLKIGDKVSVAEGSASLVFSDGSALVLDAHSELILDSVSAFRQNKPYSVKVVLPRGSVNIQVPQRTPRTRFRVKTPAAVAAVRGTNFRVSSISDANEQSSRSEVLEGQVEVASEQVDSNELLAAGYGVKVNKGEALGDVTTLLEAPEWDYSCSDPGYVAWKKVELAESYRLDLLENTSDVDKVLDSVVVTGEDYTFTGLKQDECYRVKVHAVDGQAFRGFENQRELCYIELPDAPAIQSVQLKKGSLFVSWSAVKQAKNYILQVSHSSDFNELVSSEVVDGLTFSEQRSDWNLPLYVRVISETASGLQSPYSDAAKVEEEKNSMWVGFAVALAVLIAL